MRKNNKILSQNSVFELAYNLRKQGKVVGLTHGAFDLFHVSHLDLLRKSKDICDFLIVGVDSDESIKAYKDRLRPIIREDARADILSELYCVKTVFIKDKYNSPVDYQQLYKEIKPNFITIGQNYSAEEQIKYDVSRTSSKLIKLETRQDYTTTKIINLIINLNNAKSNSKE